MESEERPTKIRKVDHSAESPDTTFPDSAPTNGKHEANNLTPAEAEPSVDEQNDENPTDGNEVPEGEIVVPKLSKNQLKKQKRLERWEAGREDRKVKRKEKIKAKKERKREEWRQNAADGEGEVAASSTDKPKSRRNALFQKCLEGTQVPITVIFDCDFEDLMFDNELKSLGLQITRCYSDNRKAKYQAHLALSSFGGKLKERFDGILAKQYTSWKGFQFFSEDFVEVAEKSKEWMKGNQGGSIAGAILEGADSSCSKAEGEVVYLSSESDNVLERLKPNSTYIIGGLVDKNRHKGVCYKRAMNRGIRTAKLPIGEFLHMKSRQVLVTNHVLEIMLKWMEFGDWGKAFMEVIPKRKGGVLKSEHEESGEDDEEQGAANEVLPNANTLEGSKKDLANTISQNGNEIEQPEDLVKTAGAEGAVDNQNT